eukprot:evm.model.scf_2488.1 EVM.evm.TU.scf_2488.1   scf_2488:283-2839(-)
MQPSRIGQCKRQAHPSYSLRFRCSGEPNEAVVMVVASIFNIVCSVVGFISPVLKVAGTAWSGSSTFGVGLTCGIVLGVVLHWLWHICHPTEVEDEMQLEAIFLALCPAQTHAARTCSPVSTHRAAFWGRWQAHWCRLGLMPWKFGW